MHHGRRLPLPPARPALELRLSDNAVLGVSVIRPPEKRRFPFTVFPRGEAGQLSGVPVSQLGNWKERSEKAESPSPSRLLNRRVRPLLGACYGLEPAMQRALAFFVKEKMSHTDGSSKNRMFETWEESY